MTSPDSPHLLSSLKLLSKVASVIVIFIGGLALVGWMFDIEVFKSGLPGLTAMNPVTALAFILAGVSLGLLGMERADERTRRIGKACASIVALVGLLKLAEYLFGLEIGIDQVLFRGKLGTRVGYPLIRMAPNTAFNFFLLGSALLILDMQTSHRGHRPAQYLTLFAAAVSFLALTGYAYGVKSFYGVTAYIPMALNTAIGFAVLCAGLLFSRPDRGLMAVVTSRHSGGVMARRLLPTMTGVLLLVGWLRLAGQREGLYETAFGTALLVVVSVVILGVLVWMSARGLDRKESERQRVAEDVAQLAAIVESSDDAIIGKDLNGVITSWNIGAERLFGYSASEAVGHPVARLIPSDRQGEEEPIMSRIKRGEKVEHYETVRIRKDGRLIDVSVTVSPIKNIAGQIIGASKVARDITERKQAAEELSSQTRILKSVLASIGEGVVVADLNGKFLIWNPAAERIIQLGPVDVPPEQWTKQYGVYLPDQVTSYPADQLPLARAIRGESMDGDEQFLRHAKAPQGIWLSVTGRPLCDESGVLQGGVVAITDITERKRAEKEMIELTAQLQQVNKELEAFSYSVSHDLRAPLRHIDGFSQILLEDYAGKLDDEGRRHLQRVRAASQQMAQLIDDLLNLSRVTRAEMRRETVDLSRMAEAVAEALKKVEPDREVAFVIGEGLVAEGDARLLKVLLDNLLGNAWKYTGKRPQARIEFGRAERDGKTVYFIRDNGAGFDMAYAHKLFGAFQRLHSVSEFLGTGIGLATVQRIIHRHGGQVWAEGEVDKGATFYFTL